MAERATALSNPSQHIGRVMVLATTTGLLNGDTSAPVAEAAQYDLMSLRVSGTFGAGGSVALEGSHDNVTYFALPGVNGVAIAITAAGGAVAAYEACAVRYVRARVTAGDGTTNLTATIFLRK